MPRSREEIVAGILEAAKPGETKTKIMYKMFLSWTQVNAYLDILYESGSIDYDDTNAKFTITEDGEKVLQNLRAEKNLIKQ